MSEALKLPPHQLQPRHLPDPQDSEAGPLLPPLDEISSHAFLDEDRLVTSLIDRAAPSADEQAKIAPLARRLAQATRDGRHAHGGIDAFLHEYALSSGEGVILMCLAEALLRIPDRATADALIADKLAEGRWDKHLGHSDSVFVNASTWGLLLSGRTLRLQAGPDGAPTNVLKRLVAFASEDRYFTVAEAYYDWLDALQDWLDEPPAALTAAVEASQCDLMEPVFIGRTSEMDRLDAALESLQGCA